jgi:alpha-tubulin suppressor-like RCC1 family protein
MRAELQQMKLTTPNGGWRGYARALLVSLVTVSLIGPLVPPAVAQVTGGSSGLGSTGSLADPPPVVPNEPPREFDRFEVDPNTGNRSVTATGDITFPQRSITLQNDEGSVTASVDHLPDEAAGKLFEAAKNGYVSAPIEYTASAEAIARGATIARTFSVPIPLDSFFTLLYYDEQLNDWVPVPTQISQDRRTITAQVEHLSWWSDFVSSSQDLLAAAGVGMTTLGSGLSAAGNTVISTSSTIWNEASQGLSSGARSASERLAHFAGSGLEASYKGVFTVFGDYQDPPECTGEVPDWVLDPGATFFDRGVYAPLKFCAGHVPGQDSILSIKASLNRSYPVSFRTVPEEAGIKNSAFPDLRNILDYLHEPSVELIRVAKVLGDQRIVMPGESVSVTFEQRFVTPGSPVGLEFERGSVIEAAVIVALNNTLDKQIGAIAGPYEKAAALAILLSECSAVVASLANSLSEDDIYGLGISSLRPLIQCLSKAADSDSTLDRFSEAPPSAFRGALKKAGRSMKAMGFVGDLTVLLGEYAIWDNPAFNGNVEASDHDFRIQLHSRTDVTDGPETLARAIGVDMGFNHSCAVLEDRTVTCWGSNYVGQLGQGTETEYEGPGKVVGLRDVRSVTVGSTHTCALEHSGTVKCWGQSIGLSDQTSVPVKVENLSGVREISAGHNYNCAVINDGTVECWGITSGVPGPLSPLSPHDHASIDVSTPIEGIENAIAVSSGWKHACAILADRTVKCWGDNTVGKLGNEWPASFEEWRSPELVQGLVEVVAINAGVEHTCVTVQDGSAWCWGRNTSGKLGHGNYGVGPGPVRVFGLSSASEVGVGNDHSCARLRGGTVSCWGSNFYGQLGTGDDINTQYTPVGLDLNDVRQLSVGGSESCAVLWTGVIKCWGPSTHAQFGVEGQTQQNRPLTIPGIGGAV